jgi:HK97 family phage prohead protease
MSETIKKAFEADVEVNVGKREVLAVISTDAIDRDNEVVSPKGMRKRNFAGNPVVMVNHDYTSLPIGKALWVKSDGNRVLAKYVISDKTELARDVFSLLQDGILSAHSIGFISHYASKPTTKEVNERADLKGAKLIHRDWELTEFSVVGIPANPEALTLAVSKGYAAGTLKLLGYREQNEGLEQAVVEQAVQRVSSSDRIELATAVIKAAKALKIDVDVDRAVLSALKQFA